MLHIQYIPVIYLKQVSVIYTQEWVMGREISADLFPTNEQFWKSHPKRDFIFRGCVIFINGKGRSTGSSASCQHSWDCASERDSPGTGRTEQEKDFGSGSSPYSQLMWEGRNKERICMNLEKKRSWGIGWRNKCGQIFSLLFFIYWENQTHLYYLGRETGVLDEREEWAKGWEGGSGGRVRSLPM